MIISRTPFRISFFGGGTDYPVWLKEHPGAVLSTTIDKYCYISCRYLPPFFEHRSRIVYSTQERVNRVSEIEHPSVRACLLFRKVTQGVEVHHDGDLPARTGIGSSSSFTVGMLHSLYALQGRMASKRKLAAEAIHVEQDLIKENVGAQDQIAAAYGGFNLIEFAGPRSFSLRPVTLPNGRLRSLESHLSLYFTGLSRHAHEIAGRQIAETHKRRRELKEMYGMVFEALEALNGGERGVLDFGRLLHESWRLKRSLTPLTSTPEVDEIYAQARKAGALGGKLLGAGGGGFFLVFAKPEDQPKVRRALKRLLHVPFRFDASGSQIVVYRPPEAEG